MSFYLVIRKPFTTLIPTVFHQFVNTVFQHSFMPFVNDVVNFIQGIFFGPESTHNKNPYAVAA